MIINGHDIHQKNMVAVLPFFNPLASYLKELQSKMITLFWHDLYDDVQSKTKCFCFPSGMIIKSYTISWSKV